MRAAPRTASDVDGLLRTRAARIYNADATELTVSEHWASVSRLELLVAFLESARNRRAPTIAEDDGGWGDASGSDDDAAAER